jgi:transketolase
VSDALRDVPHRLLALGVGRRELRRYGTPEQHVAAHGLDAAGIRRAVDGFLVPREARGRVRVAG